ncbi:hypothetical protein [Burkholderia pyrrocinia]|nr:hypothetical protein [Burkholderia pyrrocinia]
MDIITQIEFRLNPAGSSGYATAGSMSEEMRTKRARCTTMAIDRRQMSVE